MKRLAHNKQQQQPRLPYADEFQGRLEADLDAVVSHWEGRARRVDARVWDALAARRAALGIDAPNSNHKRPHNIRFAPGGRVVIGNKLRHVWVNRAADSEAFRAEIFARAFERVVGWARARGLPTPPVGANFFVWTYDLLLDEISDIPIAAMVKASGNAAVSLLPDYTFFEFKGSIKNKTPSTVDLKSWDVVKRHFIKYEGVRKPLSKKRDRIFFRGGATTCDATLIREFLHISASPPLDVKLCSKNHMFCSVLNKYPDAIVTKFLNDGEVADVVDPVTFADNRAVLDLPGFGPWSTRLKFLLLTRSSIVRVAQQEVLVDSRGEEDGRVVNWATFVDGALPRDLYHETVLRHYTRVYDDPTVRTPDLRDRNVAELRRTAANVRRMGRAVLADPRGEQKRVDAAYKFALTLTQDRIHQYMYRLMMFLASFAWPAFK